VRVSNKGRKDLNVEKELKLMELYNSLTKKKEVFVPIGQEPL
jgi:hypothetical protein